MSSGTAKCWGDGTLGALGDGKQGHLGNDLVGARERFVLEPVHVDLENIVQLAAGRIGTCAVSGAGAVWCWGRAGGRQSPSPRQVDGLSGISHVAIAYAQACALDRGGDVSCWPTPGEEKRAITRLGGISGVKEIAVGGWESCARTSDAVSCWRPPQPNEPAVPAFPRPEIASATQLALGDAHGCARLADGTARCWGWTDRGALGHGALDGSKVPVTVDGLSKVVQVAAGTELSCARVESGAVYCWGANDWGQVGDGSWGKGRSAPTPRRVVGIEDAVEVAAGGETACARLRDDSIRCWGSNTRGQLGNGDRKDRDKPTPVLLSPTGT